MSVNKRMGNKVMFSWIFGENNEVDDNHRSTANMPTSMMLVNHIGDKIEEIKKLKEEICQKDLEIEKLKERLCLLNNIAKKIVDLQNIQEKRETGEFFVSSDTFLAILADIAKSVKLIWASNEVSNG